MITLAELQLQVRQRADIVNSNFIAPAELTSYINSSIAELYDLLCESFGEDYFVTKYEFTTTDSQSYTLTDDFYELKRVDLKIDNTDWVTVPRFNLNQDTTLSSSSFVALGGYLNVKYRLIGNTIKLAPLPSPGSTVRILYVPLPTQLADPTDTLQDFNYYSEYVIVDAAIKCMAKAEDDVTVLMAQKAEQKARIIGKAANRDVANPEAITDIYDVNYFPFRGVR